MKEQLTNAEIYLPADNCLIIRTIESHAGGEPFRVIVSGFPDLVGETILEKRRDAKENYDHIRKALMWEPRGHADMYGCIVTPPVSDGADLGVLFMHNEGYSSMCGHGIIALSTVLIETGVFPASEPETVLRIDTPAGLITSFSAYENGRVGEVRFTNVPSFVAELDASVLTSEYGEVRYDLAFGGAFYAYVNAGDLGLQCEPSDSERLIRAGRAIKQDVMESREIIHPLEDDLGFLYGVIFVCGEDPHHSRNVCIFADGEVDRSPTGTGVSGRLAIHHARGEIGVGERIEVESIVGSVFRGSIEGETEFGGYPAVIPSIAGEAFITGKNEFYLNAADEIGKGFFLR
ncbi:MAG: proline racemase family protein [Acidobacteriota bacterium]|nr:proline racemase family protein [Acidobacteriota bacterium]